MSRIDTDQFSVTRLLSSTLLQCALCGQIAFRFLMQPFGHIRFLRVLSLLAATIPTLGVWLPIHRTLHSGG